MLLADRERDLFIEAFWRAWRWNTAFTATYFRR
jgi:hypothetical protein